jgi:Helix-turn-helix domain
MSHVWEHSAQKSGALIVLLAMADFAHDDGAGIFASIQTLARKSRLRERQVQNVIRELRAAGEIELVDLGGGRHQTNTYRINLKGAKIAPFDAPKGCNVVRETVQSSTEKGATGCTPKRPEPLENRYRRAGARKSSKRPSAQNPAGDRFREAASLGTLKDLRSEAIEQIDEITRPGGCAHRIEPTDPAKIRRLTAARGRLSNIEAKIDAILANSAVYE